MSRKLLSAEQAAKKLKIHSGTLIDYVKRGKVRCETYDPQHPPGRRVEFRFTLQQVEEARPVVLAQYRRKVDVAPIQPLLMPVASAPQALAVVTEPTHPTLTREPAGNGAYTPPFDSPGARLARIEAAQTALREGQAALMAKLDELISLVWR